MAVTSRLQGLNTGLAIKAPVLVASTGNLTLSATQVVDGIAVSSCDRVLVKDQTTASEDGIYLVESGSWSRAKDFDGSLDVVQGTLVYVNAGTANNSRFFNVTSTGKNIPGSNTITFAEAPFSASLAAALNTNSFPIDESEAASQAASSALTWPTDGNTYHVTTSTRTTFFSLGEAPQAGSVRRIIFDTSGILTHSTSILALPSSADIEVVPGDVGVFYADSTTLFVLAGFLPHVARDISAPESIIPGNLLRNSGVAHISSASTSDTATSIQLHAPVQGAYKEVICLASATHLIFETTLAGHVFLTGSTAGPAGTTQLALVSENLRGTSFVLRGITSTSWSLGYRSTSVSS
jgi:hypothetical protein